MEQPLVLSEFGGNSYLLQEHCYSLHYQHGYGFFKDMEALADKIIEAYEEMVLPSLKEGLCGSIYTQLSDVEDEVNGLYTYDRKRCKVNKEKLHRLSQAVYKAYDDACDQ